MGQTSTKSADDPNEVAILIVEDEILIRITLADFLRERGFHVIEAANADEALRVIKAEVDVGVVFSDVQMPGSMDGIALARWMRQHRPQTRVLLTTGLSRTEIEARTSPDEHPVVPKPYSFDQVIDRLREILER